ncbi:HPP family protein [Pseudomonas sp. 148P]|uniref:HPP family protein n=1 Tax=Pseudomonas ulcerans TaxID=3115852 RepID=A0ABU7HL46_9PSED|nr:MULTISPECIES: HPP family protein [unclassified Pseudomonas]MEE1920837.1 HPP family protein [Pseudomonas sp. 147P]MEE1932262.1 HPP family protein [Pseudomonas sp. 148P]
MSQSPLGTSLNTAVPARVRIGQLLLAGLGAFLALGLVGTLAERSGQPWLIGSFGASCVLLFGFPKAPFSRPRNVIGGHLLSSCIGLACLHLLGPGVLPMSLACALALVAMGASDTTHPPAGGNPIIVFMTLADWSFALVPTLAGVLLLTAFAWLYGRALQALRTSG